MGGNMKKKIFLFVPLLLFSMISISFGSMPLVTDNPSEMLYKERILSSNQTQPALFSSLTSKYVDITPLIFDLNQLPPAFQNGQVDFFLVNGKRGHLPKVESTS